jgi:hypothetical protein
LRFRWKEESFDGLPEGKHFTASGSVASWQGSITVCSILGEPAVNCADRIVEVRFGAVEDDDLVAALPHISPLEETVRAVEHNSHLDVVDDSIGRRFGPDRNKGGAVGLLLCDESVYSENILELALGMVVAIDV